MKAIREARAEGPGSRQIKVRRFPPFDALEVESRLEEHPEVIEAVVVQRLDTQKHKRLYAYVLTRGPIWKGNLREELREWVCGALPAHKVPDQLRRLRRFPVLPSGLVDRRRLATVISRSIERSISYRKVPEVRAPWNEWKFEGVVTAWERVQRGRLIELAHRGPAERRLTVHLPTSIAKDIKLSDYLAVRGVFGPYGRLTVTHVHRPRPTTRMGLEDTKRVLEAL